MHFFFFNIILFFIFGCAMSSVLCRLSLVAESGELLFSCSAQASHYVASPLQSTGSRTYGLQTLQPPSSRSTGSCAAA